MASIAGYIIGLTLLGGIGAFFLGRLTVRINGIENVTFKMLLYLGVAIMSVFVTVTPAFFLAFEFMNDLGQPPESHSPTLLEEFLLSISYLVYYAVLYLSFRMGTGRVHGHG